MYVVHCSVDAKRFLYTLSWLLLMYHWVSAKGGKRALPVDPSHRRVGTLFAETIRCLCIGRP